METVGKHGSKYYQREVLPWDTLLRCFFARSDASVVGLRGDERDGVGEKGDGEEEAIVCMVSPLDAGVTEIALGTGMGGAGGLRRRGGSGGGGLLPLVRVGGIAAGAEMTRALVLVDTDDDAKGTGPE
jgi:hypothetical protein